MQAQRFPASSFPAARGLAGVSRWMPCSWSQLSLLMWEVTRVVGNGLVSSCCAHLQEGTGWGVNPCLGLQAVTPAEGRRAEERKECQAETAREQGEENRSTFTGNSCKTPTHFCGTRIMPRAHRKARAGGDFFMLPITIASRDWCWIPLGT